MAYRGLSRVPGLPLNIHSNERMSTPNGESEPRLAVVSLQSRIGAEIRNVTLSEDIDDATIATIRAALLKYKVIFFRDQHQMDDRVQEAFAEQLGEPIKHSNAETAGNSEFLLDLDAAAGYAASAWHTDLTCLPAYPAASILRAIEVPKDCGDTMWANTAAAYGDMPPPLQLFADHLRAIHTSAVDFDTIFDDRVRERVGNAIRERGRPDYSKPSTPLCGFTPKRERERC